MNYLLLRYPYILSFIAGLCTACGFAPIGITSVSIFGITTFFMIILTDLLSKTIKSRAGFIYGFTYVLISCYWVVVSLHVYWDEYYMLLPLVIIGWPLVKGITFFCIVWLLYARHMITKIYFFVLLVIMTDFFWEFILMTPWNFLGYIWNFSIPIAYIASLVGVYGLTFYTLMLCGFLAGGLLKKEKKFFYWAIILLILGFSYGWYHKNLQNFNDDPNISIRIVQPNIPQREKFLSFNKILDNFKVILDLSQKDKMLGIDYVIWPETAIEFDVNDFLKIKDKIFNFLPRNTKLITGILRTDINQHIFNHFVMFNSQGKVEYSYDKINLVPFGEYIPLYSWLPEFLKQYLGENSGFYSGKNAKICKSSNKGFIPSICYDGAFSSFFVNKDDYQWIINITNDAWFGYSFGPFQNLEILRWRAVEQGVPIIRVANTGISCLIDVFGSLHHVLPLNKRGVIDFSLSPSLKRKPPFSFFGNYILIFLLLIVNIILFIRRIL